MQLLVPISGEIGAEVLYEILDVCSFELRDTIDFNVVLRNLRDWAYWHDHDQEVDDSLSES